MAQVTQQIILEYIAKTDKLQADLNKLKGTQTQISKETANTSNQLNNFNNKLRSTAASIGIAFSVAAVIAFAKEIVNATATIDRLNKQLTFVAGGSEQAAFQMDRIRKLAVSLKLDIVSLSESYVKFISAAKLSGLTLEAGNRVFENVSIAARAMNLTVDQTNGVFLALQQIVSKGNVQAEELRGQLGERLPGAFSIAAKSMGKTEQEFNKLLQTGQVLSKDFLPAFSEQLRKTFEPGVEASLDSYNAQLIDFKNTFYELRQTIGEDIIPVLTQFFKLVTTGFKDLDFAVNQFFDKLGSQVASQNLFNKSVEELTDKYLEQFTTLEDITNEFNKIDAANAKLRKDYEDNIDLIEQNNQKLIALQQAYKQLAQTLKEAATGGGGVGLSVVEYSKLSLSALEALADAGDKLARKEIENRKKAAEAYKKMFDIAEALIDKYLRDEGQRLIHQLEEELKLIEQNTVLTKAQKTQLTEIIKLKIRDADAVTLQVKYYENLNEETQSLIDKYPALAKALQLSVDTSFQLLKAPPNAEPSGLGSDTDTEDRYANFIALAGAAQDLFSEIDNYAYQSTSYQLSLIEQQNEKGLLSDKAYESAKKKILEKEAERRKRLAIFESALEVPLAILSSIKDGPAAIVAATILSFAKLAEVIAVPTPKFAKGTERVKGGQKGKDSVLSLLMPDEAVIKADENMKRPGMAKAWNEGRLDDYILRVYAPKLMQKLETQQKFDDSNMLRGFNELIITNKETNKILKKLDKNYNPYRQWN